MKNEYSIEGVKCGGCVAAVKEKLSKLDTKFKNLVQTIALRDKDENKN